MVIRLSNGDVKTIDFREKAPELLQRNSEWFQTWQWGGKRNLRTGKKLTGFEPGFG